MSNSVRNIGLALLVWVGFANLPFMAISHYLWIPYRPVTMAYLAGAFLLFHIMPRLPLTADGRKLLHWAVMGGFIVLLGADLVFIAVHFFGLAVPEMIASLPMLLELNLAAYGPYLGFIVLLFVSTALFIAGASRVKVRRRHDVVLVGLALSALAAYDYLGFQAKAHAVVPDGSTFTNVLHASQFSPAELAQSDTHVLMVVVEAWGAFKDPDINTAVRQPFDSPALRERFDVRYGTVPFYGSTTAAEMRELCLSTSSYLDVIDDVVDSRGCLPQVLKAKGYATVSYHGYASSFFERDLWYPKLGFARSYYGPDLVNLARETPGREVELCGGTFEGVCDRQIGTLIKRRLERAPEKTFAYWLTLNSHFPTQRSPTLKHRFPCAEHGIEIDSQVCIMADYWQEVFAKSIAIANADTTRPTTVLIVGDHAPPILKRHERERFARARVPYVVLAPKSSQFTSSTLRN